MYLYLISAACWSQHPTIPSLLYSLHLSTLFPLSLSFKYRNMKLSFHLGVILLFFFFLVSSSKLCARPLTTEQGRNRSKVNHVSGEDFVFGLEGGESFKQLLGMEDCNGENEECLQRRMSLEAHLDYIYTQHHKH